MERGRLLVFLKIAILCLLAGTAAGILLLTAVFLLPTSAMQAHVAWYAREGLSGESANSFLSRIWEQRESFTDAIILQNATEEVPGKNAYERAMMVYRYDLYEEDWTPEESLLAVSEGEDTDGMYLKEYSRYWHGYLVFVKPLLLVFSVRQILILLAALQLLLLVIFEVQTIRGRSPAAGIAVLLACLMMRPAEMTASITMSICWSLTLLVLNFLAADRGKLEREEAFLTMFLITGMLTSFLDLLTYPIVTLGFPLGCFFLLKREEDTKKVLRQITEAVVGWVVGYIGIWGMKWVVADLTLHQGTIKNALWTVIERTESVGGRPRLNGTAYAIKLNLALYQGSLWYWVIAASALFALISFLAALRKTKGKGMTAQLLPLLVVFLLPLLWIGAAQNHSAIHARFTYRILAVSLLALIGVGITCIQRVMENKSSNI